MDALKELGIGWGIGWPVTREPEAPQVRAQPSRAWFGRPDVKWIAGYLGLMMARTAMAATPQWNGIRNVEVPVGSTLQVDVTGSVWDPDGDAAALRVVSVPQFVQVNLTRFAFVDRMASGRGSDYHQTLWMGDVALALSDYGLEVFNTSSAMVPLGNLSRSGGYQAGEIRGSQAFVLGGSFLSKIDLSDPTRPSSNGTGFVGSNPAALTIDESRSLVWVTYGREEVEPFRLSSLTSWASSSFYNDVRETIRNIHQEGGEVYISDGSGDMHRADVGVSSFTTDEFTHTGFATTPFVRGGDVYMGDRSAARIEHHLAIVMARTLAFVEGTPAGSVPGQMVDLQLGGPFMISAENEAGIARARLFDARNMTQGRLAEVSVLPRQMRRIAMQGNEVLITDDQGFSRYRLDQMDLTVAPQPGDEGNYTLTFEADDLVDGIARFSFNISVVPRTTTAAATSATSGAITSATTGSGLPQSSTGTSGVRPRSTTGVVDVASASPSSGEGSNAVVYVLGAVAGGLLCLLVVGGLAYRLLAEPDETDDGDSGSSSGSSSESDSALGSNYGGVAALRKGEPDPLEGNTGYGRIDPDLRKGFSSSSSGEEYPADYANFGKFRKPRKA